MALFCLNQAWAGSESNSIVIILNKSAVFDQKPTESMIRNVFSMGIQRWSNELPVRIYVFPADSEINKKFLINVLHVFPYQIIRSWERNSFSGYMQQPIVVNSSKEMLDKVRSVSGAIGYISHDALPADPGVIVVEVAQ